MYSEHWQWFSAEKYIVFDIYNEFPIMHRKFVDWTERLPMSILQCCLFIRLKYDDTKILVGISLKNGNYVY